MPADDWPAGDWTVEHRSGRAQALHDHEPSPGARRLVVCHLERPAVVLGSTQRPEPFEQAARSAGFDLARRRSGGGAVVLVPDDHVWIDVVLPAGDPLWVDDVERATWWLGEAWAALLADGAAAPPVVHHRGVSDRALGRQACFAAVAPGEVSVARRKVVGISQRRTRHLARFQCLLYLDWDPAPLLDVLGAAAGSPLAAALGDEVAPAPWLRGTSVVDALRDLLL